MNLFNLSSRSTVLIILFTFTVAAFAQAPATGARIFNGKDGSGLSQDIPIGNYAVSGRQLGGSPDKPPELSVAVAKGFSAKFCEETGTGDGGGKCEEFGEGLHNLQSANFNFIKVWVPVQQPSTPTASTSTSSTTRSGPPPLIAYEQNNWGGRSQIFYPGMYRSIRGEFGKINDNMIQSAVIAKGFSVRFCSYEGDNGRGSGDCEIHEEGRHNLRFANSISFVEVKDLSDKSPADEKMPVILYEDSSQGGKMQGYDVGEFAAGSYGFKKVSNDTASSITVKSGYRATVCSDEGVGGAAPQKCEEFGPGKFNLKNKDSASYIKVWKVE